MSEVDVPEIDMTIEEIADQQAFTRNFKIIMTVVMFLEVFIGLIPHKCEACRKSVYPLSFLNCFSAGIFISIAFVHVLPDTTEEYMEWAETEGYNEAFPLPTFMAMIGYVFILLIDKVIARAYHIDEEKEVLVDHCEKKDCKDGEKCEEVVKDANKVGPADAVTAEAPVVVEEHKAHETPAAIDRTTTQLVRDEDDTHTVAENAVSKTSGVVLCLALGVHAFFEGISFGMMPTADQAGQLAFGILIHKGSSVISLGGALSRSGFSFKTVFCFLLIFAVSAPIGIAIGMNIEDASPIVTTIFMGISAGTFLYVASSEIIVNEFARGKHQIWKFIFVVLGATLITLIWLLEGEEAEALEV